MRPIGLAARRAAAHLYRDEIVAMCRPALP
jgi:hypothetical protein